LRISEYGRCANDQTTPLILDRVLSEAIRLCKNDAHHDLHLLPRLMQHILAILEERGEEDLALSIANHIMSKFRATPEPGEEPAL